MSIVQEWEGREKVYIPTCDVCGAQLSPQYSFMDAVKLRRAAGWKTKRIGKDYVDICDECREADDGEQ